ncbi:MAG: hypothetical protein RQ761_04130 [Bacteroidales bacterium]|nr:hypothetical protein [Bacteroidales bacterium]
MEKRSWLPDVGYLPAEAFRPSLKIWLMRSEGGLDAGYWMLDFMVSWFHGFMVSWFHGFMVSWFQD